MLEIKNLHVTKEKEIIKGINMKVDSKVALMGPNGSGKSTLAYAIAGHPDYQVEGEIIYKGKNLLEMKPEERAKLGLFLGFQHPVEVPGVKVREFLRAVYNQRRQIPVSVPEFNKLLVEKMKELGIRISFAERYLNEGMSGGEKKKLETLQMNILEPEMPILDETDSGTDIDALKTIANAINKLPRFLLITHYRRMLDLVEVDKIYVMVDGKIVEEGGKELAEKIEQKGYAEYAPQA